MNIICKQYIHEVRLLFPIMGKSEKEYLDSISSNIEDYCLEENIDDIQTLYDLFGSPIELVHTYFSCYDSTQMIKKIQIKKWIHLGFIFFISFVFVCSFFWAFIQYRTTQLLEQERLFFEKYGIENQQP